MKVSFDVLESFFTILVFMFGYYYGKKEMKPVYIIAGIGFFVMIIELVFCYSRGIPLTFSL